MYRTTALCNDNVAEVILDRCIPAHSPNSMGRKISWIRSAISKYDLIHTGGYFHRHLKLARLSHLRNRDLSHLHTFRVDVSPNTPECHTPTRRKLAEIADLTTAVSKHTAHTAKKHLGVEPRVIYNGVDTEQFHPHHDSPGLLMDIDAPTFLYVGSLVERKRPNDVVSVAEAVPEAHFLIVGDGPMYEELDARCQDLPNVHCTGHLPKETLPSLYANCRSLLFPSIREGCPNVVLEAMASGIPVVGYRATSMGELVTNEETGYLVAPGDTDALSNQIERLLDEQTAAEWGANARSYVKANHGFEEIARQYKSCYRAIL